jgi:hypothetical protein
MKKETIMEQFLRIARARLRKIYRNKQQRRAWAAKMYARWQERKLNRKRVESVDDNDVNMFI